MSNYSADTRRSRRRFLKLSAAGLAGIPASRVALAQTAQKVDETSEAAKALDYHSNASRVTNPKRKKDEFCHNCQFFQGKPSDAWAPCLVLGAKEVANKGWCTTWTVKA